MPLRSNGAGFGAKCAGAFTFFYRYATIPLLLVLLCCGHQRAIDRMLETARLLNSKTNVNNNVRELYLDISRSQRWTYYLAFAAFVVFVFERIGRRKLRKVGDEIEWLVTNVLHDMHHNLVDMREKTRMIERTECDPVKAAREIGDVCRRQAGVIAEYMQLAIGFKSYTPKSAKDINLTSAVWGVVKKARGEAGGLNIDCATPAADVFIKAHLELVGTILDELVGNAVKFTESGSVTVTLEEKWRKVRIAVADTGRGMSREDLRHAFEVFYRSPSAISCTGTGLGLAMVHAIVKGVYRGGIRIKSKLGSGTTVVVTLPKSISRPWFA